MNPLYPTIKVNGASLILHPYKAVYWKQLKTLLISDLHLGKAVHFRKEGIPMPRDAGNLDFDKLIALFLEFDPKRVIFLGDLFHSDYNPVWEEFGMLLSRFDDIQIDLVVGNHDILDRRDYELYEIGILEEPYELAPFLLSHHPMDLVPEPFFNLAGHIHPAVRLSGPARQNLRLPCFYFGKDKGLLPAFGALTGNATIHPVAGDRIYVIAEDEVIRVQA
ncbi:MAG: ligase-associated DNA damage response endonuclease PdeM [Bacteroidetes bacterium]|nr:ligase-associated DNA damage response endonuclease PdeM [Bacteroidota bacterium]